jgi:uncharacterized membrane protein HdeD (DUF308 family)
MMCPGALPVGQQIALLLLGPPITTFVWLLMSRGWAGLVQGGAVSEHTKKRQKWEFWILLTVMYAIGLGSYPLRLFDLR